MGSSREQSPDWLRCFQAPTASVSELVLSSDSEPSYDGSKEERRTDSEELSEPKSPKSEDDQDNLGKILGGNIANESRPIKKAASKSPKKGKKLEDHVSPKKKTLKKSPKKRKGEEDEVVKKPAMKGSSHPVLLSSDSDLSPENSPRREKTSDQIDEVKDKPTKKEPEEDIHPSRKEKRKRDVKTEGNDSDLEAIEKAAPEKQVESHVSSVRLPLILSEKVQRTKALVECEGDSIDLGGDMGSVGRVVISDTLSGDHEMFLDLKGTIYKTTIVPSRTFCVVSFGQSEAKIEAIMNDFIQLKPQSNVFEAETMVEGTLEGYSFESDEEGEKAPKGVSNQNNEDGETKSNGKTKAKSEKTSGAARKRAKTAGGKSQPQKKVKKKAPAAKKAKTKK